MSYLRNPLSNEEQKYIRDHSATMSVKDIAKKINRGNKGVYDFIEEEGLPVFRQQADRKGSGRLFAQPDRKPGMVYVGSANLITGFAV